MTMRKTMIGGAAGLMIVALLLFFGLPLITKAGRTVVDMPKLVTDGGKCGLFLEGEARNLEGRHIEGAAVARETAEVVCPGGVMLQKP